VSGAAASPEPRAVLVVGGDEDGRDEARAALAEALAPAPGAEEPLTLLAVAADAAGALGDATVDERAQGRAPRVDVVVVLTGGDDLDGLLERLATAGIAPPAGLVLLTDEPAHIELSSAFDDARVDAVLSRPATARTLGAQVRSMLRRGPRHGERAGVDPDAFAHGDPGPASELLRDLELDDVALTRRLLAAVDRALGPRPVLHLTAGTRLTHQDIDVNGVFIVRSGSVALDRETTIGRLRLHHATTGPVVGLLSLTQRRRAYFTAVATTDVEVVHLTTEQLDHALRVEPEVGAAMASAAVQALARRLRRSEQLQIEREQLNRELEHERSRLAETVRALEAARFELVEQARLATLGELAAGVAHELNNPVAALTRAATYVAEDVTALLADHPHGGPAADALERARTRTPISTAEERARRRALATAVDDELARRLAAAGFADADQARRLAAEGAEALRAVEHAADLGAAVRNLEVAATRIRDLVDSLRSYARPQQQAVETDVHATIDDALRLMSHRLADIEIERRFAELPPVRAHPGPLSQVWTNLLVNAAEALDGSGRIEIRTDVPDPDHVRVEVIDDGPGIDPDLLPQLLEPRFTTKQGVVRYGLGLGLPIAKQIVDTHRGTLRLRSSPGRTTVEVTLPVTGPDDADGSRDPTETEEPTT
jgi:two-component system, NtrC family, sensor kinase